MRLNTLKPADGARTERTRVGRGIGSGLGKTAGDTAEVMLYQLDKLDAGDIDFAALRAAKLVHSTAKRAKIVAKGELSKKFVLKGLLATAGAKAAIEAAGGKVEE